LSPRVSVLLPVRDARTTLDACLDSLAAQTLADHEVIAVDDGSQDGCAECLEARMRRDSRLRVLHTPPLGLVPALNRALASARAPIIARMDADDLAHPARLERQAERLERDAATDVLGCRVEAVGVGGGPVPDGMAAYVAWQNTLLEHETIGRERFVESPLVHPSVAMRRAALLALSGYREFAGPEDYELWLRAFERGLRFAKLEDTLLAWRDGARRLTRADPRYHADRFLALKLAVLERGPLAARPPIAIWGAGRVGKAWSRALRARGHRPVAFVEVDPRKLGQRIHGTPVMTTEEAGQLRGALHLAAVGRRAARERIRAEASRLGLPHEGLIAVA
jgi:glycosyltransferase involved in cell wall biosynthesis